MNDPKPEARMWRLPDTYLILVGIALVAYAATWLVPPGFFAAAEEAGRRVIQPDSFRLSPAPEGAPLLWSPDGPGLATFLFEGLVSGDRASATIGVLAFMFIIGGVFGVIMRTGAVERALQALLRQRANDLLPAGLFVGFSLCGAVFGMSEEAIAFALIVVPVLVRAGYDSLTGLMATYLATQIGFATSWMNPFSVVVAQGIADVPPLSGLEFRVALWVVFTLFGAAYVTLHARSVRLKPERSPAFASDAVFRREAAPDGAVARLSRGDWAVLGVIAAGVLWVAWGVSARGYYLAEISGQFFVIGVAVALIARAARLGGADLNDFMEAFRGGAAQMTPAVLVIAAAKGVVALLGGDDPTEPSVLNTALNAAAQATAVAPDWATAWAMYLVQSVINVVIVSGSGQAALTMPLMAPLGDLSGVTRQTTVLAFQLGDGLTNVVTPASAALMGCLAAARLDWLTWVRFIWKPLGALMLLSSGAVILAQAIGYV